MTHGFRRLLLTGFLALAMLAGAPLHPDKIEELLSPASRPAIVHVVRDDSEDEPPPV